MRTIMRIPNSYKIETFKELMDEITYDWDTGYNLNKDQYGNYFINKLYIEPKYVTYKTECHELEEGLFEKVEKLWELLND